MFLNANRYLFIAAIAVVLAVPSASAKNTKVDQRNQTIDSRLNCFSQHASETGINWDEVCATDSATKTKQPAEQIEDPEDLDQMVKRLQGVADDMLNKSQSDSEPSVSVDEVYKKHQKDAENKRSVDDVIIEQGVKHEFSSGNPQVDKKIAAGEGKKNLPAWQDFSEGKEKPAPRSDDPYKQPVPGLFDEPELMSNQSKRESVVEFRKHSLTFEYERYYYTYTEPSIDVELEDWFDSLGGTYTYRPQEGDVLYSKWMDYYSLEGRYAWADLDYTSGATGHDNDVSNKMYEIRGLLGKEFHPVPQVVVTPYGGYGFRYLLDEAGNRLTSTGHFGYDRKSHYHYVPLGFFYTYQPNKDWRIVGNAEFDYFVFGVQKSYLGTDAPVPGYFDISNDQKHGFGVRASVKFVKILPVITLGIEPFVRYWHIDDSEIVDGGWVEPENKTIEAGVRASVQF